MREELLTIQAPSTFFGVLSWVLLIATSTLLTYIFFRHRHLFVKPSMWLLAFTHLLFQWPCTLLSGFYATYLPNPYTLILIVHLYVLLGLCISFITLHGKSIQLWGQLHEPLTQHEGKALNLGIATLTAVLFVLLGIYLSYVPLRSVGLYAMIFDPAQSAIAREESLKLLDSKLAKYAYSFVLSAVSPLLVSLITLRLLRGRLRLLALLGYLALLAVLFLSVSLTGARVGSVMMLLTAILTYLFYRGFRVNYVLIGALLIVALLPAVLLSLAREGKDLIEIAQRGVEYFAYIGNRAFVVPLEVGVWYVHYAQTEGIFLDQAYPWLAAPDPTQARNLPHVIGLTYAPQFYGATLQTISAPSGYLFSTYLKAGLLCFPLSLLGLMILDLSLLLLERINRALLLAGVASLCLGTMSFLRSEYTTSWLTHGFGVKLVLLVGVSWLITLSIRQTSRPSETTKHATSSSP